MKVTVLGAAAIALSVAASPLRLLTTPSTPTKWFLPDSNDKRDLPDVPTPFIRQGRPCAGRRDASPFGRLLRTLGIQDAPPFGVHRPRLPPLDEAEIVRMFEGLHDAVPLLQSGEVRIVHLGDSSREPAPISMGDRADRAKWRDMGWRPKHHEQHQVEMIYPMDVHGEWAQPVGPHGHRHGHGHGPHGPRFHGHGFAARLHRALHHLSTPELLSLIFVLGVGAGSLLHLAVIVFVLLIRAFSSGGGSSCRERRTARRAARRAAKEAKRAAKAQKGQGQIRLEGAEHEEPPRYSTETHVHLDEKA